MKTPKWSRRMLLMAAVVIAAMPLVPFRRAAADDPVAVEGQPLAENAKRLLQALDVLGAPLAQEDMAKLQDAIKAQDAIKIQKLLDPHVLVLISINPEARVKAKRGDAKAILQQGGYTPVLLKVV